MFENMVDDARGEEERVSEREAGWVADDIEQEWSSMNTPHAKPLFSPSLPHPSMPLPMSHSIACKLDRTHTCTDSIYCSVGMDWRDAMILTFTLHRIDAGAYGDSHGSRGYGAICCSVQCSAGLGGVGYIPFSRTLLYSLRLRGVWGWIYYRKTRLARRWQAESLWILNIEGLDKQQISWAELLPLCAYEKQNSSQSRIQNTEDRTFIIHSATATFPPDVL